MPFDRASLERAFQQFQEWLQTFDNLNGQRTEEMQQLLDEYSKALIRIVGAGTNGRGPALSDEAQRIDVLQDLGHELEQLLGQGSKAWNFAYTVMGHGLRDGLIGAYLEFGRTTADRLAAAIGSFEESPEADTAFLIGRNKWLSELHKTGNGLVEAMNEELLAAELDGIGQHELANRIAINPLFRFENLPNPENARRLYTAGGRLGENEALQHRANVIVRDALAQASNKLNEKWTQEAGYSFYVNINPLDGRTTPACREASAAQAKTLEQWMRWRSKSDPAIGGLAPRHYLCRSQMFAVPKPLANLVPAELEGATA